MFGTTKRHLEYEDEADGREAEPERVDAEDPRALDLTRPEPHPRTGIKRPGLTNFYAELGANKKAATQKAGLTREKARAKHYAKHGRPVLQVEPGQTGSVHKAIVQRQCQTVERQAKRQCREQETSGRSSQSQQAQPSRQSASWPPPPLIPRRDGTSAVPMPSPAEAQARQDYDFVRATDARKIAAHNAKQQAKYGLSGKQVDQSTLQIRDLVQQELVTATKPALSAMSRARETQLGSTVWVNGPPQGKEPARLVPYMLAAVLLLDKAGKEHALRVGQSFVAVDPHEPTITGSRLKHWKKTDEEYAAVERQNIQSMKIVKDMRDSFGRLALGHLYEDRLKGASQGASQSASQCSKDAALQSQAQVRHFRNH